MPTSTTVFLCPAPRAHRRARVNIRQPLRPLEECAHEEVHVHEGLARLGRQQEARNGDRGGRVAAQGAPDVEAVLGRGGSARGGLTTARQGRPPEALPYPEYHGRENSDLPAVKQCDADCSNELHLVDTCAGPGKPR